MPTKKPSGEAIYEFRKKNPKASWADISKHYEQTVSLLQKREARYRKKNNLPLPNIQYKETEEEDDRPDPHTHKVRFEDEGFKANAYSISKRITSLPQLLTAIEEDLSKWKVSRYLANVWESGRKKKVVDLTWNNGVMTGFVEDTGGWQLTDLWQIKAWFEPRLEEPYEKALEDLIDRVSDRAPVYDISKFTYKEEPGGYLVVPNMYDVHLGKRSHRSLDYTLKNAADEYTRIANAIVGQIKSGSKKPSRVLFPVGHDMIHVDTLLDQSSAGNWREMSEDIRKAIDAACEVTSIAAESFATLAPVDIVPVEGNHDRLQTYWLGKFLGAYFRNHPYITVADMNLERQYYQWGRMGLGLTHDGKNAQQLATLFPIEARYMWPEVEWTEWLTGHFHHERGTLYAVDSVRATVVRTIAALCNQDNYHSLHMYVGAHRAADVLYYHDQNGPAGSFPVFVSELG